MNTPRRLTPDMALGCTAAVGVAMLAFGLYLQHVVGLEPCPMCVVQRYALVGVVILAAGAALAWRRRLWAAAGSAGVLLAAGLGAVTAARQSWLQWYPPEVVNCGRDFYGMVENFPLGRAIPMIFKGTGDCAKIDWTFWGGSIANWSFLAFVACAAVALWTLTASVRRR